MARQKKRAKSPVNIPIILAAILLCLTLISIRLAGGIVARYTTTTNSGDSARVIKFGDISLTLTGGNTQYIIPGMPLNWNASVSFEGSESATYVFVEVTGVHSASSNTVTLCFGFNITACHINETERGIICIFAMYGILAGINCQV